MASLIARRLLSLFPTVVIASLVIFSLTLLLPGDPTIAILGEEASIAEREALRRELGLDRPIYVQYLNWIGSILSGDFGTSLRTKEPVLDMLLQRGPVTMQLTVLAIFLSVVLGVPLGVVAAVKQNTLFDLIAGTAAVTSLAIPYFWAGILLIMAFSVGLSWLPAGGFIPITQNIWGNLLTMILPALSVGTAMAALVMRQTRGSLIECMSQDYIRTARAKGASEARVVLLHGLRNALVPVATVIGLQASVMIGGAVVTETIFSLPGLGRMIVDGVFWRDFTVVQGAILFVVLMVVLINLLTDIICIMLDPRIAAE